MKIEVRNIADVERKKITVDENSEKSLSEFLTDFIFESFELLEK